MEQFFFRKCANGGVQYPLNCPPFAMNNKNQPEKW